MNTFDSIKVKACRFRSFFGTENIDNDRMCFGGTRFLMEFLTLGGILDVEEIYCSQGVFIGILALKFRVLD